MHFIEILGGLILLAYVGVQFALIIGVIVLLSSHRKLKRRVADLEVTLYSKTSGQSAQVVTAEEPIPSETPPETFKEDVRETVAFEVTEQTPPLQPPVEPIVEPTFEPIVEQGAPEPKSSILKSNTLTPVINYIKGGNIWVTAGLIFLVLGLTFFYLYISRKYTIPPEFKISAGTVIGLILFIFAFSKRSVRPNFSLIVQGGGLGIIYLSFFAGFKIYSIIPLELAFALLAVIVAVAALLAFLQDSEAMAFFAAVIGFAAPILLSTGTNNYIALFSFYTVLNLCVLAAAFRKYWRYLNGVSFLCTYAVGFAWAREYYIPENFIHILIFATIFFVIFTLVNFLSTARTGNRKVENVFAVATPFAYMATLLFITRHFQYGQAIAAFFVGIFYYLLYLAINRAKAEVYRPLAILYLPFAIIFLNFSVPLALSGEWTTAIWALEGAMLAAIGGYQKNRFFRFFGLLLILGAFHYEPDINHFGTVFLNSDFVCRILTAASMLIAAGVFRLQEGWEKKYLSYIILLSGAYLWYSRLIFEISANSSYLHERLFYLAAFSVSGLLIAWGGKKLRWFFPQILAFSPLIAACLISLGYGFLKVRVTDFYWAGWLIFVLVQAALLYIYRDKEINKKISLTHAASLYFTASLVGESLNYGFFTLLNPSVGESLDPLLSLDNAPYILTHSIFLFIVLSAVTIALLGFKRQLASPYPEKVLSVWRLWGGGFITLITLCCLFWLGGASEQVSDGVKTLPVFNTADAASLIIVVTMILYLSRLFKNDLPVKLRGTLKWIRGLAVFFWANALIGRAVFFFSDDSYYSVSWLMSSSAYQLAIAVFWALTGFIFVAYGVKKFSKTYWSIGAALLVIDAIKLFLIDLSRVDTIQRILSFLGVGVIFILIGYFFPLPSVKKEENTP